MRPARFARAGRTGENGAVADTGDAVGSGASISRRLAQWSVDVRYDALPPATRGRVGQFLLDYLGIALRGSTLDSSRPVRSLRQPPGPATVLGRAGGVGAEWAALANGMAAHSMELDDTYLPGSVHNESFVLATVLALAQERDASGREVIEATVAGWEVACRAAAALRPAVTNARGFHPTGTCGALGAATAAARMLGLDAERTAAAIGIATSQASGLLEYVTDGAWTKRFHAGWAAHAGIVAARLAAAGMTAPATAIEGRFGFLHAYSGDPDTDLLLDGLGDGYAIDRTALKYHPCNYYIQSVNDSVLALVRDGVRAEDVASVLVHTVSAAVPLVCEPLAVRRRPAVMIDAQFSVPFNVALALSTGRVSFRDFTPPMFADPGLRDLMDRVDYRVEPDFDRRYPAEWPGRVDVVLHDGSTRSAQTLHARGDPRNPLSWAEVVDKHRGIVAGLVAEPDGDEIIAVVEDLDRQPDMAALTRALSRIRVD